MSLPMWTKYDANMYRSLSLFPEELENKPLSPSDFTSHFKDFYGRPVQDIAEALHRYGQQGYFNFELTLAPEYLKNGDALAEVMVALNRLADPDAAPDKYRGLGKQVYDKVLAEQPLTKAEASVLPDGAKPYLAFKLFDIKRQRLNEELVIYDSGVSFQPSRLVKITQEKPATKFPPLNIGEIKLKPVNYDKHTGVLSLAPFHDRPIAGKAGVKRPDGKKYDQCRVMECVFKSDKTLRHGIKISSILVISENMVDKTTTKKIENTKTAINNKVATGGGPKNLLKIQNGKIFLNNSYL